MEHHLPLGSHSVTRLLTRVNALVPARPKQGTRFTYQEWKAELTLMFVIYTQMVYLSTDRQLPNQVVATLSLSHSRSGGGGHRPNPFQVAPEASRVGSEGVSWPGVPPGVIVGYRPATPLELPDRESNARPRDHESSILSHF